MNEEKRNREQSGGKRRGEARQDETRQDRREDTLARADKSLKFLISSLLVYFNFLFSSMSQPISSD